MSRNSKS